MEGDAVSLYLRITFHESVFGVTSVFWGSEVSSGVTEKSLRVGASTAPLRHEHGSGPCRVARSSFICPFSLKKSSLARLSYRRRFCSLVIIARLWCLGINFKRETLHPFLLWLKQSTNYWVPSHGQQSANEHSSAAFRPCLPSCGNTSE